MKELEMNELNNVAGGANDNTGGVHIIKVHYSAFDSRSDIRNELIKAVEKLGISTKHIPSANALMYTYNCINFSSGGVIVLEIDSSGKVLKIYKGE